jgi:hypothetical protein
LLVLLQHLLVQFQLLKHWKLLLLHVVHVVCEVRDVLALERVLLQAPFQRALRVNQ